ncbi:MAG: Ig-like domain-containing protein [Planctomycetota bacterium]
MRTHPALPVVLFVLVSCDSARDPAFHPTDSLEAEIDPNQGGVAREIRVAEVSWGRLADVYAVDAAAGERILVAEDLVVGPDIRSDGRTFEVDTDPITAITTVTVLHAEGTSDFDAAWRRLEGGLVPISEKTLDLGELPPFPSVPRDAAIVVRFDDPIDPSTLSASSIQLLVGAPPSESFPARVFVDGHDSTRVILDTTISRVEALESPVPLAVRPSGLPPSGSSRIPNVALVVWDDVVRAMRSGSRDDAHQGLLADLTPPRIVGVQAMTIDAVAPDSQGGPQDFVANLTHATLPCAAAARLRDVLVTPTTMAVVTRTSNPPVAGKLVRVHVRVIAGPPLSIGPAVLESVYRPPLDASRAACFVRFTPTAAVPPDAGISTDARIVLRFSEPMDPATVSGLENVTIATVSSPSGPRERLSAVAVPNVAQDEFHLTPAVPLDHAAGASETYFLDVGAGPEGPRDLAGNPLRDALPQVPFHLDPSSPARGTENYVLQFESVDEDGSGHPELRGQFLHELVEGAIRPRSVSRFAAIADRTQAVPARMFAVPSGVNSPLSPLGSRLHALWRYCDVGMGLVDESFMNVDVEGLAWSPIGGVAVPDQYALFEISLAHSGFLPDELRDPISLLPQYVNSGVVTTYAQNPLDPAADPLRVVHPRQRGYTVNPADLFLATTGTPMMPWPLNRNLPPNQFVYYTWRDTAIQAKKAPNGTGAELGIVVETTGMGTAGVPFPAGLVPTIGLPLLMEFKCFPDATGLGLNALDANIAINASSRPSFRAFSTGGTNSSGIPVMIDPDLQAVAQGGFNPNSIPPGLPTPPIDNVFHIGQMDLVVRVSRVHSVWIDARLANASFAPPIVEPAPADQPAGAQVELAFRGANAAIALVQRDASTLDPYGDSLVPAAVTYLNGDPTWKASPAQMNGAKFVQVRMSFVSNAATGDIARMTAMGLAFYEP